MELDGLAGIEQVSPHGCISRISAEQFIADPVRQMMKQFGDCGFRGLCRLVQYRLQPFLRLSLESM